MEDKYESAKVVLDYMLRNKAVTRDKVAYTQIFRESISLNAGHSVPGMDHLDYDGRTNRLKNRCLINLIEDVEYQQRYGVYNAMKVGEEVIYSLPKEKVFYVVDYYEREEKMVSCSSDGKPIPLIMYSLVLELGVK